MLWISDVHGNIGKVRAFLEYKPEIPHGIAGDYLDSYVASDEQIIETLNYIMAHDNVITLSGNHDNQYFKNATNNQKCSGLRNSYEFVKLIEKYKDRLLGAYVDNDYIVTHAGVHPMLYKPFNNINELCEWINSEFEDFKNHPDPNKCIGLNSKIFNIGSCRGGYHSWGGPFWLDYRYEKLANINQVFGHTKSSEGIKLLGHNSKFNVAMVDTVKFECYNTETHEIEDFMPEEAKQYRSQVEICF